MDGYFDYPSKQVDITYNWYNNVNETFPTPNTRQTLIYFPKNRILVVLQVTAYLSGAPDFTPVSSGLCVT